MGRCELNKNILNVRRWSWEDILYLVEDDALILFPLVKQTTTLGLMVEPSAQPNVIRRSWGSELI